MAKSEHGRPEPNRARSEIQFVLRRAKWRRGPGVMRDMSRAADAPEDSTTSDPGTRRERRTRPIRTRTTWL